jgi:hypothetical protein
LALIGTLTRHRMQQTAIASGMMFQYAVQYATERLYDESDRVSEVVFRLPWALQALGPILLLILSSLCPRTPHWLASQGRFKDMAHALRRLHPDISPEQLRAEMERISAIAGAGSGRDGQRKSSLEMVLTRDSRMRTRLLLAVGLQAWTSVSGIMIILNYILHVLHAGGIEDAATWAFVPLSVHVAATALPVLLVDRLGRRWPLIVGTAVQMACLVAIGSLLAVYGEEQNVPEDPDEQAVALRYLVLHDGRAQTAVMAMATIFAGAFACTTGPIQWVYPAELFHTRCKPFAVSIAMGVHWALMVAMVQVVPMMSEFPASLHCKNICFVACVGSRSDIAPVESLDYFTYYVFAGRKSMKFGEVPLADN